MPWYEGANLDVLNTVLDLRHFSLSQGQVSAEGILHLVNPNSGMRILGCEFLGPEFWGRILGSHFSRRFLIKEPPQKFILKKFTAQNSHQKIYPRIRTEKFTLHFCRAILLILSGTQSTVAGF